MKRRGEEVVVEEGEGNTLEKEGGIKEGKGLGRRGGGGGSKQYDIAQPI